MYLRDPSHAWHLISPKYTTTYTSSTATAANTLLLVLSPLIALPPPTSGYRERETCVKISECFMSLVPWYLWTDFSQHRISALASNFFVGTRRLLSCSWHSRLSLHLAFCNSCLSHFLTLSHPIFWKRLLLFLLLLFDVEWKVPLIGGFTSNKFFSENSSIPL